MLSIDDVSSDLCVVQVLVLLLCFFVEDESSNQCVIERIMQLPLDVQTELMSLIESGLGKVNSESLPSVQSNPGTMSFECCGSRTPARPSKHHNRRSILHQGLDSPAGRRWLASPAISARKRRAPKTPLIASIVSTSMKTEVSVYHNL